MYKTTQECGSNTNPELYAIKTGGNISLLDTVQLWRGSSQVMRRF